MKGQIVYVIDAEDDVLDESTPPSAPADSPSDASACLPAPPPNLSIRVIVADDHPVVRKGLISTLSASTDIEVIGEADNGHDAFKLAFELRPDVLLLDICMPRINGFAVAEMLHKECPETRILVVSAHHAPEFVVRVLRAGAFGFVIKEASTEEILQAVQSVYRGEYYFSSRIVKEVAKYSGALALVSAHNSAARVSPRHEHTLSREPV